LSDFPSISVVRFRWLLAVLVALSLIVPRQVRSGLPPVSATQELVLTLAADSHAEAGVVGALSTEDATTDSAECGDTHAGDPPYEMDQILSLFSPHWGTDAAQWGGIYCASLPSDPVFPIDRPPKTAARAAWASGDALMEDLVVV
jgi:hypothetical protein